MRAGAILLVGGRSTRMGRPKAELDWHGEPLAARVARVLARAVGEDLVVVVRAPGQDVPPLPEHVEVVADSSGDQGPLRGLTTGLAALRGRADVAFVSSVDVPFLRASFVTAVLRALGPAHDAAAPVVQGRRHPLAAAYQVALLSLCEQLLAEGERRPNVLLDRVRTRLLDEAELPGVDALRNVNTQAEYDEARACGPPLVTVEVSGAQFEARAWHLEEAFAAAGLVLDGDATVAVGDVQVEADPWYPLAMGDRVSVR
jgi:molybdopterin-guanine dinucleotide biosynthesis protein A